MKPPIKPRSLPTTLPLASYASPDEPVLLGPEGAVTAAQFFSQAAALAATLPQAGFAVNVCETRHGFMAGFAAALMRGHTTLLPPAAGPRHWEPLFESYPHAYLLTDGELAADAGAVDVRPALRREPGTAWPAPGIDAGLVAAVLFTSGSTGQPTAHAKTWAQLWQGAGALERALQWPEHAACAVVGSVPPQHMFGLEATVMLPWRSGVPVFGHRPLLAADLEQALRGLARPAWWMTTPLLMRAPLAHGVLPGLDGVLASTMNLPADLAAAAEVAWKTRVIEIYGSTETGAVAWRRTAAEILWTPLPEVSVAQADSGFFAAGGHVNPAVRLNDELRLDADGRFEWLGRSADLVKIGGKRASLAALNAILGRIAGIEDGVFLLPDANDASDIKTTGDAALRASHRLVVLYVSTSLAPVELRKALRGRVDPAFMPRPLYRVPQLPRDANGKLPRAALMSLLEQCRRQQGHGVVHDVVQADHPALTGHFPGDPVVPGALLLSRIADAIHSCFPASETGELKDARFHAKLRAGQHFTIRVDMDCGNARFEVRLRGVEPAMLASGRWNVVPRPVCAEHAPLTHS